MTRHPFNPAHSDFSWTQNAKARSLAVYPLLFELALVVRARQPHSAGRPAHHPDIVYVYFGCLLTVFGSHRQAAAWLRTDCNWQWLREQWAARGIALRPEGGPARTTCNNGLDRLSDQTEELLEKFRVGAIRQAWEQGMLAPSSETAAHPHRSNIVVADGTVPKMRLKKKTYQDRVAPGEPVPAATKHVEGGGVEVWGKKFVVVFARPDDGVNTRVMLDVQLVADGAPGGEAAVAVQSLLRIKERAPGFLGCRYDGAFRGKHTNALMKAGLTVVSPPNAGIKPRILLTKQCDCGLEHVFSSDGGWLCLVEIFADGTFNLRRLEDRKLVARKAKTGFRHYVEVELPCGQTHRERLDQTSADKITGFNRAEHLRQHPKGSAVYDETYGWRNDAESGNNNLDSSLYRGRMIADSVPRQILVMLGFAVMRNAMSWATWLARQAK